ncbi:uncharacterized protein LOC135598368 [Musa acuminata AAA Group]|uniref:uncharacterized protein LOC135598368 n=1 Tax=Musa acuminata AAA Group TaxID=214697 RepID=UPI0031D4DB91
MVGRPPIPPNSSATKSIPRPNISPALYAIPESTPLPDSPSSFPPASPYIINHKRRGPRLLNGGSRLQPPPPPQVVQKAEAVNGNGVEVGVNGSHGNEFDGKGKPGASHGGQGEPDSVTVELQEEKLKDAHVESGVVGSEELAEPCPVGLEGDMETEDFFDPQDSLSTSSNPELDRSNGSVCWRPGTPSGEYFDAFEEISSDGTSQSYRIIEDELRETRLNLLMEIEKRKQTEEAVENLQNQWKMLSHHLSLVGLKFSAPTFTIEVDKQSNVDPAELCQHIVVSRFVADAIGRACSRAEVEMETEPLIESKNFEIARLRDRLQYYEAANREMSQRNQEAVELARQHRNRRKRRQKWFWCTVGLLVTVGATAVAWSYLPVSRSSTTEGSATESREK